jgi:hypothetical protein
MTQQRYVDITEEIAEVTSMQELKALWCFGQVDNNEYADAECVDDFKAAAARLRGTMVDEPIATEQVEPTVAQPPVKRANVVRGGKRYRLLSDDVSWTTKPQVQAVMEILKAHVVVGEVLDEATIVEAMVANEAVLETRQGGKRVWDYYKGNHAEGLRMHGNVEVVA